MLVELAAFDRAASPSAIKARSAACSGIAGGHGHGHGGGAGCGGLRAGKTDKTHLHL